MFSNSTGTVQLLLNNMDTTVTGSTFLTLFLLFIFVLLIAIIFRLSVELIGLFLTPIAIVIVSYKPEFIPIAVVIFILDGFILAKALMSLYNG